jgi:glycogen debranching enzyme
MTKEIGAPLPAPLPAPVLHDYARVSGIEWIETDGVGGVVASSVAGANTRKQHGLLSMYDDVRGRVVLVANLQETLFQGAHAYELSTNAYFGDIHPHGHLALEAFTDEPWPAWRYRVGGIAIEKQIVSVHGEHTVMVVYTLAPESRPATLVVRPLLAFRGMHEVRLENNAVQWEWDVTTEYIECHRPGAGGAALFIAHANARVEAVSFWYRGFLYERDRESHLDCIEDLFHPGYLELSLAPGEPQTLVFSTPSPRPVRSAAAYIEGERARRGRLIASQPDDAFYRRLLRTADAFVYALRDDSCTIAPGLPWGECALYRGLIGFAGILLAPRRFDEARSYLETAASHWRQTRSPSLFCTETVHGQMHPADVALWYFIAAYRYWNATKDKAFTLDVLLPALEEMGHAYMSGAEVRYTGGLIEVGYEPGARYEPVLPLGTNSLWYNAQRILAELGAVAGKSRSKQWRQSAGKTLERMLVLFPCESRPGMADGVYADGGRRDESLRSSQVLCVGIPFCIAPDLEATVTIITEQLATPFGLRTLSNRDSRYVGNGADVRFLPKHWSGSVDPTWFGCYRDALARVGVKTGPADFAPFLERLFTRGYGHISGAFHGNAPHADCDYVSSASATGEIIRVYARDVLGE